MSQPEVKAPEVKVFTHEGIKVDDEKLADLIRSGYVPHPAYMPDGRPTPLQQRGSTYVLVKATREELDALYASSVDAAGRRVKQAIEAAVPAELAGFIDMVAITPGSEAGGAIRGLTAKGWEIQEYNKTKGLTILRLHANQAAQNPRTPPAPAPPL